MNKPSDGCGIINTPQTPKETKPMKHSLLAITALFALVGSAAFAGGPPASTAAKKTAAKTELVCAVMGTKIASPEKAFDKSVYKGKTYYFCCGGCKPEFDKNPTKFVKAEPAKPTKKTAPAKKKA